MTSHNATRNARDVMWKWIGWQRQRRKYYRVLYSIIMSLDIPFMSAFLNSPAQQTSYIVILCTTKILPQDSWNVRFRAATLAYFDREMFVSKYTRRVLPWSFSMHCRWWHWGRGNHLLPLQRHTRETSLTSCLPVPVVRRMPEQLSWKGHGPTCKRTLPTQGCVRTVKICLRSAQNSRL